MSDEIVEAEEVKSDTASSCCGGGSCSSEDKNKQITMVVYILQAPSLLVGVTAIVGVIINYVKKSDVEGSIYESHFAWQIKTFWFGLLFGVIGIITLFLLIGFLILFLNAIWIIYRIVIGFLAFNDGKEIRNTLF